MIPDSDQFGLKAEQINRMHQVFAGFPAIAAVVLYGSRAKGNYQPGSDIDLAAQGSLDWQGFQQLERQLDDLLLPYKIDLSLYSQIDNKALLSHIQRCGVVFYPA